MTNDTSGLISQLRVYALLYPTREFTNDLLRIVDAGEQLTTQQLAALKRWLSPEWVQAQLAYVRSPRLALHRQRLLTLLASGPVAVRMSELAATLGDCSVEELGVLRRVLHGRGEIIEGRQARFVTIEATDAGLVAAKALAPPRRSRLDEAADTLVRAFIKSRAPKRFGTYEAQEGWFTQGGGPGLA